jgi:O-succinylbenzoate synthase
MRGVSYIKKDTGVKEIGLIAEELNEIAPELVNKNEEGLPDSVSYGRVVSYLIEAIKDLKKEIEELKSNK